MGQLLFGDAIHTVEQAKIDAARITQKSGNELRGSQTSLQQFGASLSTTRQLDAAGSNVTDIAGNIARMHQSALKGGLQTRLAAAEQMGAMSASAAAAGVAGGSVEAFNNTLRLQTAMRLRSIEANTNVQTLAMGAQAGNQMKGAVASLDNNVYRAGLDYKQYVDHNKPSLFAKIATVGLAAVATYFGGPQAGKAVIGAFEGGVAASNGDFGAASSSMMNAAGNAFGAVQQYQSTHQSTVRAPAPPAPERYPMDERDPSSNFFNLPPMRVDSITLK